MKIVKSFCTGALAGTLGFFGSRITEDAPLAAKIALNVGMTGLGLFTMQRHPAIRQEEVNYLALAAGAILMDGIGYTLQYVNAPDYIGLPLLLSFNLITHAIAHQILHPKPIRHYFQLTEQTPVVAANVQVYESFTV
jgi:hypothetical protein